MCAISGMYAFFQALMPMTGWVCVHTVVEYFTAFGKFIPWIALVLLSYIGGKMIYESFRPSEYEAKCSAVTLSVLLIQGVATSIDALSVGFTIADYRFFRGTCLFAHYCGSNFCPLLYRSFNRQKGRNKTFRSRGSDWRYNSYCYRN